MASSEEILQNVERHATTGAQAQAAEDATESIYTSRPYSDRYRKILATRRELPVHLQRDQFLELYQKNQIMVFVGETGSGKTTQIPQFIAFDEQIHKTDKMIACTQPRRVAAMSVADRVATEMDVKLGEEVGYTIRFDDTTGPNTFLKYMTDGMLLREAMIDPELTKYSCIILDEAHERTLATDILMGLLKLLCRRRPDLKLVVMSATLDAEKFQTYFDGAPLLAVPGRTHPVEIWYTADHQDDYVISAVRTVLQIHESEPAGDILVFLTGEDEIEDACRRISLEGDQMRNESGQGPLDVYPLYGSLTPDQQQRIFRPAPPPLTPNGRPGRKVIVATNIAETSLTIDGIVYVIDPGFSKQKVYNPRIRLESLLVSPISKASAQQRAGRAGRTCPGKAFRLYTQESYKQELIDQSYPEILRSNMSSTILELKKLGVENLVQFDFIDPPAPETMMRALEELNYLGCIDDSGNLTELGAVCSEFPLDPTMAVALVRSTEFKCSSEILTILAMLSVPNVFLRPRQAMAEADAAKMQFADMESDHITLLHVYNEYHRMHETSKSEVHKWCKHNFLSHRSLQSARSIRHQLKSMLERRGYTVHSTEHTHKRFHERIAKSLAAGYFMQVARNNGKRTYETVKDCQSVMLHPSTVVSDRPPEYVIYNEYVLTTKSFIRTVTGIKLKWLVEIAPTYFTLENFASGSAGLRSDLRAAGHHHKKN